MQYRESSGWYSAIEFAKMTSRNKSIISKAVNTGLIPEHLIRRDGRKVFIHKQAEDFLKMVPTRNRNDPDLQEPKIIKPKKEENLISNGIKIPSYGESRTLCEAFKSRLMQLEYDERRKKLVPADKVLDAYVKCWTALRERLKGLPGRVANQIQDQSAHYCEQVLDHEIELIFEEIRNWSPMHLI